METTEDIKSRLDIVELIAEYLPLKPAGTGAFKAVCPFHQERTPSFYVSRTRQSWHCFGCNEGGDHFSFVQKMEGMEFREALEFLAQKVGVTLPSFNNERASQRKQLHEVNAMAVRFFRSALDNLPQAEIARKYLERRQVDPLTLDLFQLGYAPDSWSALTDALLKKGISADDLVLAGLVGKKDQGGVYDRFRNRIMFPIADLHGNIVGFTSRILTEDKKEAKYINTPETSLYRKSAVLYGLDKAKGEIRQKDQAVIVEGNMDVISSHRVSVGNVVAASGTALTVEQLGLLKRFTQNLAIAFDQDAAGGVATLRGLDLARSQGFTIRIISLPPEAGKDPDEAVCKNPDYWKEAIAKATPIMDWVYSRSFRGRDATRPEIKKAIAQDVAAEIRQLVDPIEHDHWVRKLAQDLDVSEQSVQEAVALKKDARTTPSFQAPVQTQKPQPVQLHATREHGMEEHILAMIIYRPEMLKAAITVYNLVEGDFTQPEFGSLYEQLKLEYIARNPSLAAQSLASPQLLRPPEPLNPDAKRVYDLLAFVAERTFQEQTIESLSHELKSGIEVLRRERKQLERKRLEQEMRQAEREGDQAKIASLLAQFESFK